jgi:hypothetical protein
MSEGLTELYLNRYLSVVMDLGGVMSTISVLTNSTPYSHPLCKGNTFISYYQTLFSFFLSYTFFDGTDFCVIFRLMICLMCPSVSPCLYPIVSIYQR